MYESAKHDIIAAHFGSSLCRNLCTLKEDDMYEAPDIIYEGDLEVQAGSPLFPPDTLLDDPLNDNG